MDVHCLCVRYVPTVEIPRVEEVWKVGKGEEEKKRRTRKSSTTTRNVLLCCMSIKHYFMPSIRILT